MYTLSSVRWSDSGAKNFSRAASDYKLSPEHSEAFVSAWAEFDPYATGYIALVDLGGALTREACAPGGIKAPVELYLEVRALGVLEAQEDTPPDLLKCIICDTDMRPCAGAEEERLVPQ